MVSIAIRIALEKGPALLGALLRRGHADDSVDFREDDVATDFFAPIVKQLNPTVAGRASFKWRELRSFADNADLSKSSMTKLRAQELIEMGDTGIAELCQQFAVEGWPCQPSPPGSRKSGAGRDIRPTWDRIRLRLAEVAARAAAPGTSFLLAVGSPGVFAAPVRFLEQMAVSAGLPPGSGKFAFFALSSAVVVVSGAVYLSRNGRRR